MKTHILLLGIMVLCAQCTGGSPPADTQEERQTNAKETLTPQTMISTQDQKKKDLIKAGESATLRVYIDPETGEYITPPQGKVSTAEKLETRTAFSTSHDDLVEVPSPVPGGGTMIDLKGRFRSPLTATIDSNGKINIGHHSIEKKE